jgi:hypothetical protein
MGHACGYNLTATTSLSAALAARAAVDKFGLGGKLFLFRTPAEGTINFLSSPTYERLSRDSKIIPCCLYSSSVDKS